MPEVLTIDAGGDLNRSYLVPSPREGEAWCVDPSYAADQVLALCGTNKWKLTDILLTHTHGDHVATAPELTAATGARLWVHPREMSVPRGAALLPPGGGPVPGLSGVTFLETPGHTPGGVCYVVGPDLFTGDVLFVDWVGRCDFPGGDAEALFESLAKLRSLAPSLVVRPGHHYGCQESRRLGDEIRLNKFLACSDFAAFLRLLPELAE